MISHIPHLTMKAICHLLLIVVPYNRGIGKLKGCNNKQYWNNKQKEGRRAQKKSRRTDVEMDLTR